LEEGDFSRSVTYTIYGEERFSRSVSYAVRIPKVYDASYYTGNTEYGYTDYTTVQKWMSGIADNIEAVYGSVSGQDVLDIGCAFGYLTNELATRGANVIGVDSSAYAISQAQALFPTLDFRQESIDNLSIGNNKIDLIVALGVFDCLETQTEMDNSMVELNRVLRQQGNMYILTSEESNWYTVQDATTWQSALSSEFGGLWVVENARGDSPPLMYDWRIIKAG
jgi:2-polyprenyl-3-methyl-5-hydroxy-6-metoxy-1,4-benzoquinol methylase